MFFINFPTPTLTNHVSNLLNVFGGEDTLIFDLLFTLTEYIGHIYLVGLLSSV